MKICEIFHSIQGEGINAGRPCCFVRFWGCNLRCHFCDTKYSWKEKDFTEDDLKVVLDKIGDATYIVFTGGEPALFQKNISEIVEGMKKKGVFPETEIETNGSIELLFDFDTVTMSPKLKSSGNDEYKIPSKNRADAFKFVVWDEQSMKEVKEFILEKKIPFEKVWLMPEGAKREDQLKNAPKVAEYCMKYGFRFSPRLQCYLWDNKKGT